ncbi:MAG: NAD-dependent epimerase/dehydratase family protein [Desulfobacterales bacterium]|nr:NAD-dependent epimerase/dehydratase family protein [Desulfobacterales bacterium]
MADTYLVTGGAGFIGSHVANRLLDQGAEVVVADNMLTGDPENVPAGSKFVYIDLANESQYYRLDTCRPKAVLHLAGQSSGEISHESPINDLDINTKATILLAQWAARRECKRFLYTSTVSVYGDGVGGAAMSEQDPPRPKSFYACSKLASENYLKVFGGACGMDATTFRLFNAYGPGQNMDNMKQGMVSIYLAYFLNREKLEVKGSLERYRDFIYVSDIVDLLVACINDARSFGKIFNVGSGCRTRVRELVDIIKAATGKSDFPVVEIAGTPGDAFGSCADIGYVNEILGWTPKISVEEGIRKMVSFYAPGLLH